MFHVDQRGVVSSLASIDREQYDRFKFPVVAVDAGTPSRTGSGLVPDHGRTDPLRTFPGTVLNSTLVPRCRRHWGAFSPRYCLYPVTDRLCAGIFSSYPKGAPQDLLLGHRLSERTLCSRYDRPCHRLYSLIPRHIPSSFTQ